MPNIQGLVRTNPAGIETSKNRWRTRLHAPMVVRSDLRYTLLIARSIPVAEASPNGHGP